MHNILQASTFMGWAKHFDVIGTEDTMFYILNISKEKLRDTKKTTKSKRTNYDGNIW